MGCFAKVNYSDLVITMLRPQIVRLAALNSGRFFVRNLNNKLAIGTLVKPKAFSCLTSHPVLVSRKYSVLTTPPAAKPYTYDEVKEVASNPELHPDSLLVDVREPSEYSDGHIPHAVNIPFKSSPGALGLSEEEFESQFGFEKPDKEKELIFYCLAGVRSSAAEDLANTFGYQKRGNYLGSYEDWLTHENKNNLPK